MSDADRSHFLGTRGKPGPSPVLLSAQLPPMPEDTQPLHFTFLFILHIFIGANSGGSGTCRSLGPEPHHKAVTRECVGATGQASVGAARGRAGGIVHIQNQVSTFTLQQRPINLFPL